MSSIEMKRQLALALPAQQLVEGREQIKGPLTVKDTNVSETATGNCNTVAVLLSQKRS